MISFNDEISNEELEEIRQKRLEALRRQIEEAKKREAIEMAKQEALRRILTPEARSRLANLRMVKPELVEQLEIQLIQLAQSGKISIPITDEQLKNILMQITGKRRETRIVWRRD
ncbi:MAG: DNA-binding protein [Candidatus Methanomethylicia archaeon]|nr:DNA-binding protein [Candidatus Methanomethylicia archaeon]MCX8169300.1 DNA-binding protein [Candidatus Methanomethylicia archaeon]MDW7988917.1 DNA-binding protein [Nitrososphaerota archaeon]